MQYTILIADDEPEVQALLSGILSDEGYNVISADNGEEAIRLAKENLPSLILSDIKMPKKDGIQVCKELKADETTKMIPIVILSIAGQVTKIQKAMCHGAHSYITKPCDKQKILDVIESILRPTDKTSWLNTKRQPKNSC